MVTEWSALSDGRADKAQYIVRSHQGMTTGTERSSVIYIRCIRVYIAASATTRSYVVTGSAGGHNFSVSSEYKHDQTTHRRHALSGNCRTSCLCYSMFGSCITSTLCTPLHHPATLGFWEWVTWWAMQNKVVCDKFQTLDLSPRDAPLSQPIPITPSMLK